MTSPAPRILVAPELEPFRSSGTQLVQLDAVGGVGLDEAQQLISRVACAVGSDDKWLAFEVAVLCPRQNLKTAWAIARILHGLFVLGEREIVYSAHQAKAAEKMFRRLKRFIAQTPQLGGRIARVSNRLGSETIELRSGQSIECCARSTGSGRGFTGDLLILDESHILNGEQLADALPMLTARRNPQVIYLLSKGTEESYHLGRLRQRALSDDPGSLCWIEWSLADDDNPGDRRVWWNCNPGV